ASVNADTDLTLAYLRTYAGMGSLLEFMGLQKLDTHTPTAAELAEVDAASLCPADAVTQQASAREALDAKAREMMVAPRSPVVAQAPQESLAPQTAIGDIETQVRSWAEAWSAKDYSAYSGFYAPTFTPDGGLSREDWDQLRRARISPRERISVTVDKLRVRMDGEDRAFAEFEQTYRSNIFNDRVLKTLEMIKVNGKWLINRESSTPCVGNTVGGCNRLSR
ncbi:YybH family protein, partial [Azonexus hydrophilus]